MDKVRLLSQPNWTEISKLLQTKLLQLQRQVIWKSKVSIFHEFDNRLKVDVLSTGDAVFMRRAYFESRSRETISNPCLLTTSLVISYCLIVWLWKTSRSKRWATPLIVLGPKQLDKWQKRLTGWFAFILLVGFLLFLYSTCRFSLISCPIKPTYSKEAFYVV